MDPVTAIIVAVIGAAATILGIVLTFISQRRTSDLKKIELEQAALQHRQDEEARLREEEARKRREAAEKHAADMQRVTTLEEKQRATNDQLDKMRGKFAILYNYALELFQHIQLEKGPPPPPLPDNLFD